MHSDPPQGIPAHEPSSAPKTVSIADHGAWMVPPGPGCPYSPLRPHGAPRTVSIADRGAPPVSPDPGQPIPLCQPTGASKTVNIADQGALLAQPSSRKGTRVLQGAPNQPNPLQPPGAPRTVSIADRGVTMAWPGSRNGTQASDGAPHGSPDGQQVDTSSLLRQVSPTYLICIARLTLSLED